MEDFLRNEPGAVAFFVTGIRRPDYSGELLAVMPTRESANAYRETFLDLGTATTWRAGYDAVIVTEAVRQDA